METHIVNRINIETIKDPTISILTKKVTYKVDSYPDKYVITAGVIVQLPDIFEIELDEYNTHTILKKIIDVANDISFKRYDLVTCPVCGEYIHHYDANNLLCINVDCFTNEDRIDMVRLKLMTLLPSVPVNNILQIINLMADRKLDVTVSSVIYFVTSMLINNEYGLPTNMLAGFVDAVSSIRISDLLLTVFGNLPIADIDKIINYYNNTPIDMIEDLSSVLLPMRQLGISDSNRILITMIMNSNRHILDSVVSPWNGL